MQSAELLYVILRQLRRIQREYDSCQCRGHSAAKANAEKRVDEMIANIAASAKAAGLVIPDREFIQ